MKKYVVKWIDPSRSPSLVDKQELSSLLLNEWGYSTEMTKEILECLDDGERLSLGSADVEIDQ